MNEIHTSMHIAASGIQRDLQLLKKNAQEIAGLSVTEETKAIHSSAQPVPSNQQNQLLGLPMLNLRQKPGVQKFQQIESMSESLVNQVEIQHQVAAESKIIQTASDLLGTIISIKT